MAVEPDRRRPGGQQGELGRSGRRARKAVGREPDEAGRPEDVRSSTAFDPLALAPFPLSFSLSLSLSFAPPLLAPAKGPSGRTGDDGNSGARCFPQPFPRCQLLHQVLPLPSPIQRLPPSSTRHFQRKIGQAQLRFLERPDLLDADPARFPFAGFPPPSVPSCSPQHSSSFHPFRNREAIKTSNLLKSS